MNDVKSGEQVLIFRVPDKVQRRLDIYSYLSGKGLSFDEIRYLLEAKW